MRSVEGISAIHGGEEVKFLPLTLVSLGSLPKSEVGSGSGFSISVANSAVALASPDSAWHSIISSP
jgi:hypothetical protein